MDEEVLNISIRKFLKKVGVTSQKEIEKVIEEVIVVLNDINYKLKPRGPNEPKSILIDNLEDLKSYYTMESERIIHQRVEENPDENPGTIELSIEEDDESIELF